MLDLWITVNSPGEVSGWLKPALAEVQRRSLPWRVIVALPPCRYASGREEEVCRKLPGVAEVFNTAALLKFLIWGQLPLEFAPQPQSRVLFLGGDLFYAVWLKKRLRARAIAYTDGNRRWVSSFDAFVTREDIGDLRVDGINAHPASDYDFKRLRLDPEKKRLLFFPGSRPAHVDTLLPIYMDVIHRLAPEYPDWEFVINFAPFVSEAYHLAQLKQVYVNAVVLQEDSQLILKCCDLLCTLPGTNTGEAALLGVPMLVVLPTQRPEVFQLDGVAGMLGNIPLLGAGLKRLLIALILPHIPYVALPNRWAKQMLVPELRGLVKTERIAQQLRLYMSQSEWRQNLRQKLKSQFYQPGAARHLVDLLESL